MLPAVGQGALAIETRSDDAAVNEIVGSLNHEPTRLACKAERAFLKGLGGGCLVPIAAHAKLEPGVINLSGLVSSPDGTEWIRDERAGPSSDAEAVGLTLADQFRSQGADRILGR